MNSKIGSLIIALVAGTLFGIGLSVSQMTNPYKVIGFLDLFGNWDPSLAFVMGGGLIVAFIGFRMSNKRGTPFFDTKFHLPEVFKLDRPLLIGAAIFGAGWGLGGYCPGPGIAALAFGSLEPILFVSALLVGATAQKWIIN